MNNRVADYKQTLKIEMVRNDIVEGWAANHEKKTGY